MNTPSETCGLFCPDGRDAQLLSVQVHGEILGLMLRLTVRQTWRNASGAPMATRLRFGLDWDQTLLDLQMERRDGVHKLERISRDSRHGCSATPGVLATGEQVTLQWRIGQLLSLQGSSLRLQLPTALVPRAPRPAHIQLDVHEPVAQGMVCCTSHDMRRVRHAQGVGLSLHAPTGLDKDLVLTVHGLRDTGFALASPDPSSPGDCTVLVSNCPHLPAPAGAPLRIKLLVDSSSSMPVERLSQIRTALDRLLAQLQPQDQLSYSRFGERTVHDLPRLQVCTEAYQRRVRALARHTDTDLGQAQTLAALQAVLAIPDEDEETVSQADILMITASPLWHIEGPLRALHAAGHRLHVMAVGVAADSLWRELAQASGGTFEHLAPGQHSQQTLARLIERMRQQLPVQLRLQVEGAALQGPDGRLCHARDGDTLHQWAQVRPKGAEQDLAGLPVLRAALQWQDSRAPGDMQPQPLTPVLWDEQGDLTRLCADHDLRLDDPAQAGQRTARHGLLVPDTSRLAGPAMAAPSPTPASTVKPLRPLAQAPAEAQASAAPAGTGATAWAPQARPAVAALTAAMAPSRGPRQPLPRHTDLAGWLGEPACPGHPLAGLVGNFNAQAGGYTQFRAALSGCLQRSPTPWLNALVLQLARRAGNPGRVWAMLLHWLHAEHGCALDAPALRLVEQELASVPVALRTEVHAALVAAGAPVQARQAA